MQHVQVKDVNQVATRGLPELKAYPHQRPHDAILWRKASLSVIGVKLYELKHAIISQHTATRTVYAESGDTAIVSDIVFD